MEKSVEELLKEQKDKCDAIQLNNLALYIYGLKERFGDGVLNALSEIHYEPVKQQWSGMAEKVGGNSIEHLIKLLWEPLVSKGMEYTMEKIDEGVQMRCTKCHLHEKAKELGITDLAFHLFCSTDYPIVEGFNPEIGFHRTKTLMEGHDCCDHFYYMK